MYWFTFVFLFFLTSMFFPASTTDFLLSFTIWVTMSTLRFFPFSLIFFPLIFSIPAILCSFFAIYFNKKRTTGVRAVGIAGISFLVVMTLFLARFLIEIVLNPSTDPYQAPATAGIFIIIVFFYGFFVLPVILFSSFFTIMIERLKPDHENSSD